MSSEHDCMTAPVERVVLSEGDDVFVERCTVCGRVRYEQDGRRMMAWFYTPGAAFPWRYAYADDHPNTPDGPEIWRYPELDQ